jgi:hypothetical protein
MARRCECDGWCEECGLRPIPLPSDAAQQIGEPRIRSQQIEIRIDAEKDQPTMPFLHSLF